MDKNNTEVKVTNIDDIPRGGIYTVFGAGIISLAILFGAEAVTDAIDRHTGAVEAQTQVLQKIEPSSPE